MSDATDVLHAIDQLRRDLSGYHGQLKAHNDLQRHCDNQRKRIVELEELYANAKADRDETAMAFSKEHDRAEFLMRENAKLREFVTEIIHYAKYSNPDCGLCKHYDECWADDALSLPTGCIICNEARELGIEEPV